VGVNILTNPILKLPAGHFLGQTLRTHEVSGLRITETFYPNGMKQPVHAHEMSLYCFVLAGSYVETVGQRARIRGPLALAFHPVGSPHAESYATPGRHLLVELGARWIDCAREYDAVLDCPVDLPRGTATWLVTQLYDEFRDPDCVSPLAIEGVLLELMAETSRCAVGPADRRPPHWLEQVTELLHARFADNVGLSELASAVGVHAAHLARVFRKFKGRTVGDYVRGLRIEYAARRISNTDGSLADIAAAAGFSDQSHFSRTFKQRTGMSPAEFRAVFRAR
jgi:AraC family transcriptional regulator